MVSLGKGGQAGNRHRQNPPVLAVTLGAWFKSFIFSLFSITAEARGLLRLRKQNSHHYQQSSPVLHVALGVAMWLPEPWLRVSASPLDWLLLASGNILPAPHSRQITQEGQESEPCLSTAGTSCLTERKGTGHLIHSCARSVGEWVTVAVFQQSFLYENKQQD